MIEYGLLDWSNEKPWPKEPFHCTINLYDIPRTVTAALWNLPENCRIVNVVRYRSLEEDKDFQAVVKARNFKINWISWDAFGKY